VPGLVQVCQGPWRPGRWCGQCRRRRRNALSKRAEHTLQADACAVHLTCPASPKRWARAAARRQLMAPNVRARLCELAPVTGDCLGRTVPAAPDSMAHCCRPDSPRQPEYQTDPGSAPVSIPPGRCRRAQSAPRRTMEAIVLALPGTECARGAGRAAGTAVAPKNAPTTVGLHLPPALLRGDAGHSAALHVQGAVRGSSGALAPKGSQLPWRRHCALVQESEGARPTAAEAAGDEFPGSERQSPLPPDLPSGSLPHAGPLQARGGGAAGVHAVGAAEAPRTRKRERAPKHRPSFRCPRAPKRHRMCTPTGPQLPARTVRRARRKFGGVEVAHQAAPNAPVGR